MANHLAGETSPYLRQHADNPVDWYPWGPEALARARAEDKPILLSIGYSACHWCHVMAQECFEDAAVAAVMNRHFVNIKVDREERPDLDHIYQSAHALLARRGGGWPLTVFLTPDQVPFFSGTYFPKTPRYNLPGFIELMQQIAQAYHARRGDIAGQNASLMAALAQTAAASNAAGADYSSAPLQAAIVDLKQSFDPADGGFSAAPKFPRPAELAFLLRAGDEKARQMVLFTLKNMAQGGLYDQIGGGFYRYSVDARWTIPHFEKMLYDNAALLAVYTDAWKLAREPLFERAVRGTVAWLLDEMAAPEGGFYAALDADSEHEEGKFYVWTPDAVRAVLDAQEYAVAAPYYGLDAPANFEGRAWHLTARRPLAELAQSLGMTLASAEASLARARAKLAQARAQRVHPGRDDKLLTSWNALAIAGLARAGRAYGEPDWVAAARRAADFIRHKLVQDGRLLASHQAGRARFNAYLDDHAFLLDALLELMQSGYRAEDMAFAQTLADDLLARFEDAQAGGFFFTSHDHEPLIHRPKPGLDQATPAGNGVAAFALQRLGHLLGEPRYLAAAQRTLRAFYPAVSGQPSGHPSLLMALMEALTPPRVLVLRGARQDMAAWERGLAQRYLPDTIMLALDDDLSGLPSALDKPRSGHVNAWLCQGVECSPPQAALVDLYRILQGD